MPKALIVNNAATTISVAVSTVGQTAITVTSAAAFPVPTGGDYFYITLLDAANIPEVVQVTAVAGNVFTVVRARDGTAARTFLSGASARLCLCAAVFTELARLDAPAFTAPPTVPNLPQGTNNSQVPNTAYVVAEIESRAAKLASNTFSGVQNFSGSTVLVTTRPVGASDNTVASTAFVASAVLASSGTSGIPPQTGNAGKVLTTNGVATSWATPTGGSGGSAVFRTDKFTGNGVNTAYTLTADPGSVDACDVLVNGVGSVPGVGFTVVGTTLTFAAAPANAAAISIRYGASSPAIPAGNYSGFSRTIPVSVTWGTSITLNASLSNVFYVGTLTGDITTLSISNPNDGQTINIRFVQDATGGRTVTPATNILIGGAINLNAGAVTWVVLTYNLGAVRWEGSFATDPTVFGTSLMLAPNAAAARTLLGPFLGHGQANTILTGSRALGVTYTNSTSAPIFVYVAVTAQGGSNCETYAYVDGAIVAGQVSIINATFGTTNFIVPSGSSYTVTVTVGVGLLGGWVELR